MKPNRTTTYGVAALVGAGLAVWAGVPFYYLLVLGCPVMMFFMMSSMAGGKTPKDAGSDEAGSGARTPTADRGAGRSTLD